MPDAASPIPEELVRECAVAADQAWDEAARRMMGESATSRCIARAVLALAASHYAAERDALVNVLMGVAAAGAAFNDAERAMACIALLLEKHQPLISAAMAKVPTALSGEAPPPEEP